MEFGDGSYILKMNEVFALSGGINSTYVNDYLQL